MPTTAERRIAADLSSLQRNFLIRHIDGAKEIPVPVFVAETPGPRSNLLKRGLIQLNRPHMATKTLLTERGRAVLAIILGGYADALVRAGFTGIASPIGSKTRPMVEADDPVRDESYEDAEA